MKKFCVFVAFIFLGAVMGCSYKTCPTYSKIEAPSDLVVTTQGAADLTPAQ